jgi:hypothetical protein
MIAIGNKIPFSFSKSNQAPTYKQSLHVYNRSYILKIMMQININYTVIFYLAVDEREEHLLLLLVVVVLLHGDGHCWLAAHSQNQGIFKCTDGDQCGGSGFFWAFPPPDSDPLDRDSEVRIRLRILLSLSKNSKKILDSYCFVTS